MDHPTVSRSPAVPLWRSWSRRVAPALFVLILGAAAFQTVAANERHVERATSKPPKTFSHVYPPDPVIVERPKVHGPPPAPPLRNVLTRKGTIASFGRLSKLLPRGVLRKLPEGAWLLSKPVGIASGSTLVVEGPFTLDIGPGAFLSASGGGGVRMTNGTVVGVDLKSRPQTSLTPDRGFVMAVNGGVLWLERDHLSHLGHLAVLSYGLAMRAPGPGSGVIDSVVDDNYIGVYTTHANGVRISGNRILHSVVYGVDPHTESSGLTIENNQVVDSGVHGIILAVRVTDSAVVGNLVDGAGDHGIVLFDQSDRNQVRDNRIRRVIDGIVVTGSSGNRIEGNTVDSVVRFGVRVWDHAAGNTVAGNQIDGAILGAYLYGGATRNVLLDNRFVGVQETVRVRRDAPANRVHPIPPNSEIAS